MLISNLFDFIEKGHGRSSNQFATKQDCLGGEMTIDWEDLSWYRTADADWKYYVPLSFHI